MSIRVSTLCHTSCPSPTAQFNGRTIPLGAFTSPFPLAYASLNDIVLQYREAAPFYASLSARLRITGGPNNGYDGTATWTRIPLAFTGSPSTSGDGLDIIQPAAITSGNCYALVASELVDASSNYGTYRDPKKQRVLFIASGQAINGGPTTLTISPPLWSADPAGTGQRISIRYFGGVDMSTLTDLEWRDLRRTYTYTETSGGITSRYDWTIA